MRMRMRMRMRIRKIVAHSHSEAYIFIENLRKSVNFFCGNLWEYPHDTE
jgi:hypothetical protein